MEIIGIIIGLIVLIVVCILIFGGVNNEITKLKQSESEKNELFETLLNDFKNNEKISNLGYHLPLAKIISNVSIYYANADRGIFPNQAEWQQTIFSLCLICTQIKKAKDAKDFYEKFIDYREYKFEKVTNSIYLESRKMTFKILLNDILFLEKWIN